MLEAFSRCFFKYLQFVLLFASFVLIFEVKQLILVAYVVLHYKSSQIFSLKKSDKVARSKTKWRYLKKHQENATSNSTTLSIAIKKI